MASPSIKPVSKGAPKNENSGNETAHNKIKANSKKSVLYLNSTEDESGFTQNERLEQLLADSAVGKINKANKTAVTLSKADISTAKVENKQQTKVVEPATKKIITKPTRNLDRVKKHSKVEIHSHGFANIYVNKKTKLGDDKNIPTTSVMNEKNSQTVEQKRAFDTNNMREQWQESKSARLKRVDKPLSVSEFNDTVPIIRTLKVFRRPGTRWCWVIDENIIHDDVSLFWGFDVEKQSMRSYSFFRLELMELVVGKNKDDAVMSFILWRKKHAALFCASSDGSITYRGEDEGTMRANRLIQFEAMKKRQKSYDRVVRINTQKLILGSTIYFDYQNAKGERSSRSVDVDYVDTTLFKGYCSQRHERRTFRIDRANFH